MVEGDARARSRAERASRADGHRRSARECGPSRGVRCGAGCAVHGAVRCGAVRCAACRQPSFRGRRVFASCPRSCHSLSRRPSLRLLQGRVRVFILASQVCLVTCASPPSPPHPSLLGAELALPEGEREPMMPNFFYPIDPTATFWLTISCGSLTVPEALSQTPPLLPPGLAGSGSPPSRSSLAPQRSKQVTHDSRTR